MRHSSPYYNDPLNEMQRVKVDGEMESPMQKMIANPVQYISIFLPKLAPTPSYPRKRVSILKDVGAVSNPTDGFPPARE